MCFFRAMVVLLMLLGLCDRAVARTLCDAQGRAVECPDDVGRVICSGPGALRLLTYLQAQDRVVAVDDMETRETALDIRPYALANPQFKELSLFGEFRGRDNPELILTLDPAPQVVLKTVRVGMGYDPVELQRKIGIPVVALDYGDLTEHRSALYASLRTLGSVLNKSARAEEVIAFIDAQIAELARRSAADDSGDRPSVFVGGIAFSGPHGYQSTAPLYAPFSFLNANAPAAHIPFSGRGGSHTDISKEMIAAWNPDLLFLDLATLQLDDVGGGAFELRHDPAYRLLSAVKENRVYGLLPCNWYAENYGSILANAFYIGKLIYPKQFADVDPVAKADEIYRFLVGAPVFDQMNAMLGGLTYTAVPVN